MPDALLADLSSWQPTAIDWPAYAAWSRAGDGIARVILRASQGVGVPDQHFDAFWRGALAAGVDAIGVYHYAYPNLHPGPAGAVAEADFLRSVVGERLRPQDFLMLDYEEAVPQATSAWALAFLQHCEQQTSTLPRLYSYEAFIASRLQDVRLTHYPLVYARWTFNPDSRPIPPKPWTSYEFLQYSDKGVVPGIPGTVDVDVYIGGIRMIPQGPFLCLTFGKEIPASVSWQQLAAQFGLSQADFLAIPGNAFLSTYDGNPASVQGLEVHVPGYASSQSDDTLRAALKAFLGL
jgi:lysozyme